jgi:tRNA(His) guanylyltransferase
MMTGNSLGNRMKRFEAVTRYRLVPRSCMVIRVDGRAFHTFTRNAQRPFDPDIIAAMVSATKAPAVEMQGFKLAYTQSDEASFLLTDFDEPDSQGWFDHSLNKVVSISASLFTAHFNVAYPEDRLAIFDSRAFTLPAAEAPDMFIWRQRDWERNSLSMFARSRFSHEELLDRQTADVHEMLHQRGDNWAHLPDRLKNGTFILPGGTEVCERLDQAGVAALIGGADPAPGPADRGHGPSEPGGRPSA